MLASHSPSLVTFPWKPTSASALKVQTGEDKSQPISVVPLKKMEQNVCIGESIKRLRGMYTCKQNYNGQKEIRTDP